MAPAATAAVDPNSGFCAATSTFHSKRRAPSLPSDPSLSVPSFISSRPHSGSIALVDAATGRKISYSDLWRHVSSVARVLYDEHSIRKGDVMLLFSPNSILFPVATLAVMSLGAVLTTTNPLNTPGEIAKVLRDSGARLAFTTQALMPKLVEAAKLSGRGRLPVVLLDNEETGAGAAAVTPVAPVVGTIEAMMRRDGGGSSSGRLFQPPAYEQRPCQSDPATLLYSSGTTGASKGVISTHANLIAASEIIINRFRRGSDLATDESDVFICTVPMFHVYGLAVFAVALLGLGATVVILSRFELTDLMTAISTHKVTYLPLVPPILLAMTQHASTIRSRHDLRSLRRVLSGGAPLSKDLIEGFAAAYRGVEVLQGYGLTESTGVGASTDSDEESRRYGTAGLLSPLTEARIVDPESGRALAVGQTGELWLRGPYVMRGYLGNEEATRTTVVQGGWLRTGDLCYFDADGFLFVVDRLKELIKYKGYQVPPAELEALLLTHPQIADAAVVPFPDKEAGQVPMAYVVRSNTGAGLTQKDVMEFVAKQVAPYKRVRRVAFIEAIPKNASGKILRKDLVQLAAKQSSSKL